MPEEQFDAFKGFTWHRRTLPLTTLARGHGSASMKFCRLIHVLHQEQGAENIDTYRSEVKGYLSDQGTEKHLFGFPYEKNATLNSLARGLLSGDVQLDEVGNIAFLHNAYGIPGVMHILFNALESALKTSPLWGPYETELRAVGKVFSQKSYVDLVLEFTPGLSAADQELIRGLDVAVLDWRWESIEYCAKYWKQVAPILKDKVAWRVSGIVRKETCRGDSCCFGQHEEPGNDIVDKRSLRSCGPMFKVAGRDVFAMSGTYRSGNPVRERRRGC